MATKRVSPTRNVGDDFKEYAAGTYDLTADSPDTKTCARRIVIKGTASTTASFTNRKGVARTLSALKAWYVHDGHTQAITCDVAFIAYF